jgi:hypothetical protein
VNRQQLLNRLDTAWVAFQASYAGLASSRLTEPGVAGDWSVKDVIAHVTWWEEEALRHLPLVMAGGRPPRYSVVYGGIDAFNAMMAERNRDVPLSDVLTQQNDTHQRLIDFIQIVPEDQFTRDTRFRRRLRLDTYSHYPIHTGAIREWRQRQSL